jgi:hypothetical protein
MDNKRNVEIFSGGYALCQEVIDVVRREAGSSFEVIVRNMMDARSLARAEELGIRWRCWLQPPSLIRIDSNQSSD